MLHTELMGFLVGSSDTLLAEGLALELLTKSSLLCENSTVFCCCCFAIFSLLVNSISLHPLNLPSIAYNSEEGKPQGLKLVSHISRCHQWIRMHPSCYSSQCRGLAGGGGMESVQFSSVQLLSHVWLFATSWTAAHQASLSNTNSQSLLKLMSIKLMMLSNHLILCYPLLLPLSIFPSIRVFSNESVLRIRRPKYCRFSFRFSPYNAYSRLISFRMGWLDLLAVQGTLKSLLQHHSSKASVL